MSVGERIKTRRKQLELSADQLADVLGISRSTMFRYESGYIEKFPTSSLEPIAKALHTSVKYLLGWTDDPEESDNVALSYSSFRSKVDKLNTDLWISKHAAASAEYSAFVSPDMTDEQKQDLAESIRSRYEGFHISESSDIVSSLSKLTDEQLDDMFFTLIKGRDKDYLLKLASKILEIAAEK